MPFRTSFDERRQWMVVSFAGVVEEDDFLAAFDELRGEDRNLPGIPDLIDFEGVVDITASDNTIRDLARESLLGKSGPMAINAPDDFAHGVARMYLAMREPGAREIRIFRSREEAEKWIVLNSR